MWSPLEYAAPNDCQIRISSGGETKKIKVLDSEPNQSLAKSPNAQYAGIYATFLRHFSIADLGFGKAWSMGHGAWSKARREVGRDED
jgi:hypothetical protein